MNQRLQELALRAEQDRINLEMVMASPSWRLTAIVRMAKRLVISRPRGKPR